MMPSGIVRGYPADPCAAVELTEERAATRWFFRKGLHRNGPRILDNSKLPCRRGTATG